MNLNRKKPNREKCQILHLACLMQCRVSIESWFLKETFLDLSPRVSVKPVFCPRHVVLSSSKHSLHLLLMVWFDCLLSGTVPGLVHWFLSLERDAVPSTH